MTAEEPQITSLQPLKEDPCLIEVMIDDTLVGTAQRDELERSKARIGMPETDPCVRALTRAIAIRTTRNYAMGLLSRCEFPTAGLTQRLIKHGVEQELARDVVREIEQDGWIDDESYARRRIRKLREQEGRSSEECRTRLKAEWVDTSIVERLLAGEDRRHSQAD
jgi:SOS response regulatory protein OraA/RecX